MVVTGGGVTGLGGKVVGSGINPSPVSICGFNFLKESKFTLFGGVTGAGVGAFDFNAGGGATGCGLGVTGGGGAGVGNLTGFGLAIIPSRLGGAGGGAGGEAGITGGGATLTGAGNPPNPNRPRFPAVGILLGSKKPPNPEKSKLTGPKLPLITLPPAG